MADYIERTTELILAVNAGARAIENTKKYHGAFYLKDIFADEKIAYVAAAKLLRSVEDIPAADVAPVVHGRWKAQLKVRETALLIFFGCPIGLWATFARIAVAKRSNTPMIIFCQTIAPTVEPKWTEVMIMRLVDADAVDAKARERLRCGTLEDFEVDAIIDLLDDAPTIEAVPTTRGHWVYLGGHPIIRGVSRGMCSVCRILSNYIEHIDRCPSCGAPMERPDE